MTLPPRRTKRFGCVASGTPGAIRTHDLQSRSLTLYPTELRAHIALQLNYDSTETTENQGAEEVFLMSLLAEKRRMFTEFLHMADG